LHYVNFSGIIIVYTLKLMGFILFTGGHIMQITATEKFYEISFLGKESFDNFLRFIDYNYHAFNIISQPQKNSVKILIDYNFDVDNFIALLGDLVMRAMID